MATVAAVGASAWTVLSMVVARGALLGFAGALVGFAAGIVIALAQDFGSAIRALPSLDLGLAVIGFATVLSAVGAAPAAAVVGLQDPVTVLQET
jgi:ABC-type antimicrobial peptide transport system permease subunit